MLADRTCQSCSCSDPTAEGAPLQAKTWTLLTDAVVLAWLVAMYTGDIENVSNMYHSLDRDDITVSLSQQSIPPDPGTIEDWLACDARRSSWLSAHDISSLAGRSRRRTSHCHSRPPLVAICVKPTRLWTRQHRAAEPSVGDAKIVPQDLVALLPALPSWPMMASLSCYPPPPAPLLLCRRLPTRLFCRRRG